MRSDIPRRRQAVLPDGKQGAYRDHVVEYGAVRVGKVLLHVAE